MGRAEKHYDRTGRTCLPCDYHDWRQGFARAEPPGWTTPRQTTLHMQPTQSVRTWECATGRPGSARVGQASQGRPANAWGAGTTATGEGGNLCFNYGGRNSSARNCHVRTDVKKSYRRRRPLGVVAPRYHCIIICSQPRPLGFLPAPRYRRGLSPSRTATESHPQAAFLILQERRLGKLPFH